MAPSQQEWDRIASPTGPIHVQQEDGTLVAHASRGRLQAVRPGLRPEDPADTELVLSELGSPDEKIPGDKILKIETADPGVIVVVDDDVAAEAGETTISRGGESPETGLITP